MLKKNRARFYVALGTLGEANAKATVDGYIFEYMGETFGIYKSREECLKCYFVIDLKTGLLIQQNINLKDIECDMSDTYLKFCNFRESKNYEKHMNNYLKVGLNKIELSCYNWKKQAVIDLRNIQMQMLDEYKEKKSNESKGNI